MKNRIPTIIGLAILMIGLTAGVLLVQFRQVFRLGAAGGNAPKNVRLSNISDSSVTISWVTEKKLTGFVKWGVSQDSLPTIEQEQAASPGFVHTVNLKGLSSQTPYFFKINSGGDDFDNNGSPWQIKTGSALPQQQKLTLVSGTVISASGNPSVNSLVYVSVSGYLLSTLTSETGTWVITLSSARTQDLSNYTNISPESTLLEISVEAGPDGVSSAQIYPQSANPTPPMALGQVYDFRNLPPNSEGTSPGASVGLPSESTSSSRFSVPKGTTSSKTVTLDSTKAGEVITTTKPEFFGTGPSGTKLAITVKSEAITGTVQIPSSGQWQWNPPSNLSPGTHTITISWKDASGILRTLTRTFIVQAAEGPAFVSTPSASLTPSPTASLKPTSTASASPTFTPTLPPTPSSTATAVPTPVSGSLTPTLLLFIMGLGGIAIAFVIWTKSEI